MIVTKLRTHWINDDRYQNNHLTSYTFPLLQLPLDFIEKQSNL